ncbi:hypothetical protein [Micromonospora antibiotica]|uniref:Uncharacterized protein n=1 Tax=Micromonospora antibiotica TaxID=2807623 RepID=A0ABS3VH93_9ACTN|nr:hypothetical protein [Micromonospora antibiotica]MBO4165004.1 hypothetical protein [Micromonospora antibiotica]
MAAPGGERLDSLLPGATAPAGQGATLTRPGPGTPAARGAQASAGRSAATALLTDRTWTDQAGVPVRQPVDHTPRELAQIISETLGRPVTYHRATFDEYRARYTATGASPAVVDAMVEMARAQAAGVYPPAPDGGGGTTFRQWCASTLAPPSRDGRGDAGQLCW